MKYGIWNVQTPQAAGVNCLAGSGYSPLTAMILSARGIQEPEQAKQYIGCSAALLDPFTMTDMEKGVARIRTALERGEKIAVFGDYDVDGITATCLLTDFLRSRGASCTPYIPGRLEEGYGLNPIAIRQLAQQGVKLIVTVDCGITAMEQAQLCRQMGMELVITDHHECKPQLPDAVAVIDPHRHDGGYAHKDLSGVGVAFKLAAAVCGSQEQVLHTYSDMVCLGTVADVMPLRGENRVFVSCGLEAIRTRPRPGIAALMEQCGCDRAGISASSVGYILAPRINAAGRMGKIDLAVELFLTQDPDRAQALAKGLCELNRERQAVESEIYETAVSMLPEGVQPPALVLADESWHQGVVGIVASRIAEECCCPTFLICLDGEHGKASSRSYGGFNLFASLTSLSHLLESYGGHELAAGFTIHRSQIPAFREAISALAAQYYSDDMPKAVLEADCVISPELLTLTNVEKLEALEPCGNGCPKPVLVMENMVIERLAAVGGGRHLRLWLRSGHYHFQAIFFSTTAQAASVQQGETVDVAFSPQINEYRSQRTVQMNLLDIRPSCKAACCADASGYQALRRGTIQKEAACRLYPDRQTLAVVWRYLISTGQQQIHESPMCLLRKIVRRSGEPLSLGTLLTCLDVFSDVGLLRQHRQTRTVTLELLPTQGKADLAESKTMRLLEAAKESE